MTDRSDLLQRADTLRKQAEQEPDSATRDRLVQMADRYVHLAESQSWSDLHPISIASVSDIFIKQN